MIRIVYKKRCFVLFFFLFLAGKGYSQNTIVTDSVAVKVEPENSISNHETHEMTRK
jgi:hypothetical protein